MSQVLVGVGAADGLALGPAAIFDGRVEVEERRIEPGDVEGEIARLDAALAASVEQLQAAERQMARYPGEHWGILEAHRLMLADPHLVDEARRLIRDQRASAEWAVRQAIDQIKAVFERVDDAYLRERASDVGFVGRRVLRNLVGVSPAPVARVEGAVAVGHDFSPADVAQLRRAGVVALCAESGGRTSHTAIVARALGLPYVVGVHELLRRVHAGAAVVVDGSRGTVALDPSEADSAAVKARVERARARAAVLDADKDAPTRTACGAGVTLAANIELTEEIPAALEQGVPAVGLFRTEFLYLDREVLPDEDEQLAHALEAGRAVGGRPITFRTFDLGGDKMPPAVRTPAGANPVLGLRSIRYSLSQPQVFKTQLRALHRAAAEIPLRIMLPLVSGVGELRQARALDEEACAELRAAGKAYRADVPLGVMVETPGAAMVADLLARECAFLSIGTNDLIQYTLAADRENEHVGYLYHPLHPAILRMLRHIVDGARRGGIEVGMCGDMAGDPLNLWILLGLGLRDLSMAPAQIAAVRAVLRRTRVADAEALLAQAMALSTQAEVEALVHGMMLERFAAELDDGGSQATRGGRAPG